MVKNKNQKHQPTFWRLFWLFLKISIISFGGGNAIFPILKNYCVDRYQWLEEQDIDDILVITNSLPGASVVEAIAYISYKLLKSKWKTFVVTILSLLPHTLIFFLLFFLGTKYVPIIYLKIMYVAIIPVIIALLLNMTIRYIKLEKNNIPYSIHWFIFLVTTSFSSFVPAPWYIPIFVICFFFFCLLIFVYFRRRKGRKSKW